MLFKTSPNGPRTVSMIIVNPNPLVIWFLMSLLWKHIVFCIFKYHFDWLSIKNGITFWFIYEDSYWERYSEGGIAILYRILIEETRNKSGNLENFFLRQNFWSRSFFPEGYRLHPTNAALRAACRHWESLFLCGTPNRHVEHW